MSTTELRSPHQYQFQHKEFQKSVDEYSVAAMKRFKKVIRTYAVYHACLLTALLVELLTFVFLLILMPKSSLLAISLAGFLLTAFAYLVMLFYFQTKKPEQFLQLRTWFVLLCKQTLPQDMDDTEYHLSLANAVYRLASFMNKRENYSYDILKSIPSINLLIKKMSFIIHWKDLHKMKEILLLVSINEHIELIKRQPTDLEAHASLANAYIALSRLYRDPKKSDLFEELDWEPKEPQIKKMLEKFNSATEKAIQEFLILDHYVPNDPWVHAQLGLCFHDLERYDEEIKQYESILTLCPDDREIMYRLGVLYFQLGQNAQGLRIYEELKRLNSNKAAELIDHYDANFKSEYDLEELTIF